MRKGALKTSTESTLRFKHKWLDASRVHRGMKPNISWLGTEAVEVLGAPDFRVEDVGCHAHGASFF